MSVTPDFIGQVYKDTNTGNLWRANSLTPGDWTLEVQNMGIKWNPTATNLGNLMGLSCFSDVSSSKIVFEQVTNLNGYLIEYTTALLEIDFPNLTSIDSLATANGSFTISGNSALATLSLPVLVTVGGDFNYTANTGPIASLNLPSLASIVGSVNCDSNSDLTAASFPLLQSIGWNCSFQSNPLLASVSMPSLVTSDHDGLIFSSNPSLTTIVLTNFIPNNGKQIRADGCALSQSTVDHILARCVANASYVSGSVELDGGTTSPPSSIAPGSDYDVLVGRGVIVHVNP